jgi:UDP-GlcNAc:undecaprenyl-phosphate GlcNAc-1-phosphate transferase
MIGSYTANNMLGCLAPPVILGIPLFDTVFVMYVRRRKGMPVMQGSPDHFALRLRKWKLTTMQTVGLVYAVSLLLGLLGIVMMLSISVAVPLGITGVLGVAALAAGHYLQKVSME